MQKIVECVPNFSEGRRPEIVQAIVDSMTSVEHVYLLGHEMDTDHNRAVVTLAGPPEAIGEAAFRGVECAMKHIDLTTHQGVHPRIGATDVVPFIPIRGVSLDDCVLLARSLARRIAEVLHIPVYLYEAAATRPDRINLENIRKGQFEGLREEIERNPDRKPDFGDSRMHPSAGATVVGARKALIAYNINLTTPDVEIARKIAKRIRFSTGGFRYVKGMGVLLKERNQAQVSMNLTDYEQTPIELVFETVRREAHRFGVDVAGSEIVGLIPQRALEQTADYFLRVENFNPSMILENRLAEVMTGAPTSTGISDGLRAFIDRVASAEPVPGGGSVSALAGALGTALGQMAISLTKEKKNYRQHSDRYLDALDRLAPYRSTLFELIDADAEAFKRVMVAYTLPKDSPERESAIQDALIRATEIPSRTATCSAEALQLLENLRPIIHPNVASDMQVGMIMLRSSIRAAIANMRVNLAEVKESDVRLRYQDMIVAFEQALREGK
jgi:glutamate formiminotransferase/formiminotetrahydrofolate cyclodeaminase